MIYIKGHEGVYSITEDGHVYSHLSNRYRKTNILRSGYVYIRLLNPSKNRRLHRVIAEAYIPNPNNLPQINHKNGIKTDNRIDNLEWCNASYNQKEAYRIGLATGKSGESNPASKLTEQQVTKIRKSYPSKNIMQLSIEYGVSFQHISRILKGDRWLHI